MDFAAAFVRKLDPVPESYVKNVPKGLKPLM